MSKDLDEDELTWVEETLRGVEGKGASVFADDTLRRIVTVFNNAPRMVAEIRRHRAALDTVLSGGTAPGVLVPAQALADLREARKEFDDTPGIDAGILFEGIDDFLAVVDGAGWVVPEAAPTVHCPTCKHAHQTGPTGRLVCGGDDGKCRCDPSEPCKCWLCRQRRGEANPTNAPEAAITTLDRGNGPEPVSQSFVSPAYAAAVDRTPAEPVRYEVRTADEMRIGQRCAPFRYDAEEETALRRLKAEVARPSFCGSPYAWELWRDDSGTHAIVEVCAPAVRAVDDEFVRRWAVVLRTYEHNASDFIRSLLTAYQESCNDTRNATG